MGARVRVLGKIQVTPPLNAAEIAVLKDLALPSRARRSPWVPVDDGAALQWDGTEDTSKPSDSIRRLIEKYLGPEARPKSPKGGQLADFTFDHVCQGTGFVVEPVYPKVWQMLVRDNKLYHTTYSVPTGGLPKSFDKKTGGETLGAALEVLSSNPTQGLADLSSFLDVVIRVKDPFDMYDLFQFLKDFTEAQPAKLREQLESFLAAEKKKLESLYKDD